MLTTLAAISAVARGTEIAAPIVPAPTVLVLAVLTAAVRSTSFALRGRGRVPRGRGGRWGRAGCGTSPRDAPPGHPSVFHSNMNPLAGDAPPAQSALMSFFDLNGAPSINMADGLRAKYGPPFGR
jgi:hypothetical protein